MRISDDGILFGCVSPYYYNDDCNIVWPFDLNVFFCILKVVEVFVLTIISSLDISEVR